MPYLQGHIKRPFHCAPHECLNRQKVSIVEGRTSRQTKGEEVPAPTTVFRHPSQNRGSTTLNGTPREDCPAQSKHDGAASRVRTLDIDRALRDLEARARKSNTSHDVKAIPPPCEYIYILFFRDNMVHLHYEIPARKTGDSQRSRPPRDDHTPAHRRRPGTLQPRGPSAKIVPLHEPKATTPRCEHILTSTYIYSGTTLHIHTTYVLANIRRPPLRHARPRQHTRYTFPTLLFPQFSMTRDRVRYSVRVRVPGRPLLEFILQHFTGRSLDGRGIRVVVVGYRGKGDAELFHQRCEI